jgi:ribonuclease J
VDHSIPGAIGLAIETEAGWVGYSGDIRLHGMRGKLTEQFARELAELEPVALLCEGTHYQVVDPPSEADVVSNALQLTKQAEDRLVVADFSPRNVERLVSFLRVAQRTGRMLAIQPKMVYLLSAISLADPAFFPDPLRVPQLALYDDPKSAPRLWEKSIRESWADRTVDASQVSQNPGAYILAFNLWDANDLLDLDGVAGGAYLYSGSRAYDDEQLADLQRLRNWADVIGLTVHGDPDDPDTLPLHSPGHATGPDLVRFVRTVNPNILIPIHTEDPDWWNRQLQDSDITVRIPELGASIGLA